MTRRRVAITGLGIVSPQGSDIDHAFGELCAGRSGLSVDDETGVVVARAPFDAARWFDGRSMAGLDRISQIAVSAAEDARADAGWREGRSPWSAERIGVFAGTGFGGTAAVSEAYRRFHGRERIPPLSVVAAMANAPAAHIAMRAGIEGPVLTYSVACASSAVAIAAGLKDIALGEIDAALVGGAEAALVPAMIASWQAMRTLAETRPEDPLASSRPFSQTRTGLVLGEGAAFMLIEDLDGARRRGARIYAELSAVGITSDAHHIAKPFMSGQVRAMRRAIEAAGLEPRDIGYCNAHGTATPIGDETEARSLHALWGDDIQRLRVSSTKSMHGHLLGAAGALETVVTALALYHRKLPPNAHCTDPDPACDLPLVIGRAEEAPALTAAISNSFAFGGTNASIVLRHAS